MIAKEAAGEVRLPVLVRFAASHKQPFDLILTATVPISAGAAEVTVPFPRFPGSVEREASVAASVPEGLEVRGEARGWDGECAANWGSALAAALGPGARSTKAITAVAGRTDGGFARTLLSWQPYRPDLAVDLRADVTLFDRQLVVQQVVRLRSPDGLPRQIRFRGPASGRGRAGHRPRSARSNRRDRANGS